MIDWQIYLNHGNFNVAHDPITSQIQQVLVVLGCPQQCILGECIAELCAGSDGRVILVCVAPGQNDIGIVDLPQHFQILCMDLRLVPAIVPIADQRIQNNSEGKQEYQYGACDCEHLTRFGREADGFRDFFRHKDGKILSFVSVETGGEQASPPLSALSWNYTSFGKPSR